jgi:hypothetical protein
MIKLNNRKFVFALSLIILINFLLSILATGYNYEKYNTTTIQFSEHFSKYISIVQIPLSQKDDLGKLIENNIDIFDFKDLKVKAYVTNSEIKWLYQNGFNPIILYKTVEEMIKKIYSEEQLLEFHNYATMTDELEEIADNYPDISELYNLGSSVLGRTIWGLKITNNPDIEENEPEVRICGAHHGNEFMSVELPLLLAWYLVENYETDEYIEDLVNNREIWIIPMVNPDGREASSRYNANGVDLNRDYGYLWNGEGNSPSPYSQPETQVIREHALDNNFVLSLSYHTTAAYVNYIWNYKEDPTPDDDVVVELSEQYATSSGYTAIRGYNWYQTRGDTNDFSYGCRGDLDWTIETENSNIEATWDKNRVAMLDVIEAADMGLSGIVTDDYTEEPINATIWVEEAYWPCFTDPKVGDYHRLLPPGTYKVHFQANGYKEEIHTIEIPESFAPTKFNVTLIPENNFFAHQVTSCIFYDPYSYPNNFQNNPTEGISALGYPDEICVSLGEGGNIVLDMGIEGEIIDLEDESDFKIFEGGSTDDSYEVYVSSNWNGPWTFMGLVEGTSEFDLNDVYLESAQFIKIIDDDDGDPYENNPGVDIDAIQCLKTPITPSEPPTKPLIEGPSEGRTYIEYDFTFLSTDPEGKQLFYFIEWGDGNNSGWIGPYSSGETITESHTWEDIGYFEIIAKARDIDNAESAWSTPHILQIDTPILNIETISGGFFKIKTNIKNNGGIDATDLQWRILVDGGAIIGKNTTGEGLTIIASDEKTISSGIILGFGPTQIIVDIWDPIGISDTRKQNGFVYLFYVKVNPGG